MSFSHFNDYSAYTRCLRWLGWKAFSSRPALYPSDKRNCKDCKHYRTKPKTNPIPIATNTAAPHPPLQRKATRNPLPVPRESTAEHPTYTNIMRTQL